MLAVKVGKDRPKVLDIEVGYLGYKAAQRSISSRR